MNPDPQGVLALAAALAPTRAASLLARHPGIDPEGSRTLLRAPRADRLGALAMALRGRGPGRPARPGTRSGERTGVRGSTRLALHPAEDRAEEEPAWPVLGSGDVLPFALPAVAPALAGLDASLLELGGRAARAAALGLASVLGGEVALRGRVLPGLPEPAGIALIPVDLTALAGVASLAVDCGFAARLAERVAGGPGRTGVAGSLTSAERTVLELAILAALDALAVETPIEAALAPRLSLRGGAPVRPVCVELTVTAAGTSGRAFLLLPEVALRALSVAGTVPAPFQDVPIRGSIRCGAVELDSRDVDELRQGDVVLLDPSSGSPATLRLPGGVTARGRIEGDSLEVEEVDMPDRDGDGGAASVLLEVELATVSLPLQDLARIAPGAVLPLGLDRSGTVTIRIGDRAVALGELVEIDGAVGVRFTAMVERP